MRKPLQLLNLVMLVGLLVFLTSCAAKPIVLHPLTYRDFCHNGDEGCNMDRMKYGMSEYFLNEVMHVKIER